jgi:hypothetical protein
MCGTGPASHDQRDNHSATGRNRSVALILVLLVPLPLGYLIRDRLVAYLAFVGAHAFVFTFQTLTLIRNWVGGDTSAFASEATRVPWDYAVVNLVIYAAGLGLVTLGLRLGQRRRMRSASSVDMAA